MRDRTGPKNGELPGFFFSPQVLVLICFFFFFRAIFGVDACELLNRMGLKRNGAPMQRFLKEEAYKDQIAAFKAQLAEIGQAQGWTLEELRKRFSNGLWDEIIYS